MVPVKYPINTLVFGHIYSTDCALCYSVMYKRSLKADDVSFTSFYTIFRFLLLSKDWDTQTNKLWQTSFEVQIYYSWRQVLQRKDKNSRPSYDLFQDRPYVNLWRLTYPTWSSLDTRHHLLTHTPLIHGWILETFCKKTGQIYYCILDTYKTVK